MKQNLAAQGTDFPLSVVAESGHWKFGGENRWRLSGMTPNSYSVPRAVILSIKYQWQVSALSG